MLYKVRIVVLVFFLLFIHLAAISQNIVSNKQLKIQTNASMLRTASLSNEKCVDTSVRLHYLEDSFHIVPHSILKTSDGNVVIPGWRNKSYTPYHLNGYLLKVTPKG